MQINEAINRGRNLLAISLVSIAGLAFFAEFFIGDEWAHRLDDGVLFFLGVVAAAWYLKAGNRFKQSLVPMIFLLIGLIIKLFGVIIEFNDTVDIGDDVGGLVFFVASVILISWQYFKGENL